MNLEGRGLWWSCRFDESFNHRGRSENGTLVQARTPEIILIVYGHGARAPVRLL